MPLNNSFEVVLQKAFSGLLKQIQVLMSVPEGSIFNSRRCELGR